MSEKVRIELTIRPGDILHFVYDWAVIGFLVNRNWIYREEVHKIYDNAARAPAPAPLVPSV